MTEKLSSLEGMKSAMETVKLHVAEEQLKVIEALETSKINFTLVSGNWTIDNSVSHSYKYKYVFSLENITDEYKADAVVDAASALAAIECRMCPITETVEDAVIFRAEAAPTMNISGSMYITQVVQEVN